MIRKVLTMAGSDCSGGAGIQADLKTMTAFGVYGMSVITALTAQNSTGVFGIMEVDPEFTAKQIDAVFRLVGVVEGMATPFSVRMSSISSSLRAIMLVTFAVVAVPILSPVSSRTSV